MESETGNIYFFFFLFAGKGNRKSKFDSNREIIGKVTQRLEVNTPVKPVVPGSSEAIAHKTSIAI